MQHPVSRTDKESSISLSVRLVSGVASFFLSMLPIACMRE